ncbi:MAG: ABC transporter permease [Defluviitaleaceae bacterium]|nr:ABC transporter permease [Defluviitaleaceae bacterium]
MTIFNYALRRGLKNPVVIVVNFILPAAIILVSFSDENPMGAERGYYLLAMAIMFGAYFMARSIQQDKLDGTVIRILAGPVTMRGYLVQNFFSTMIPMAAIIAAAVAVGAAVHGWGLEFSALLAVCYLFLAATSVGLAFAWSCIFKDKETSFAVFSVFLTTVVSLGGLLLPLDLLPGPLPYISALLPAHWAARAIETLLQDNGANGMYLLSLFAMTLFAVAFLLYGSKRRIV